MLNLPIKEQQLAFVVIANLINKVVSLGNRITAPSEMVKAMPQANTTYFCLIMAERPGRKANALRCLRKNKVYCSLELIEVRPSLIITDVHTLQSSHDERPPYSHIYPYVTETKSAWQNP